MIPEGERKSNFHPRDFDGVFDVPLERIIIDEGHKAKNPKTMTNAGLCNFGCKIFWYVSATSIDNSVEDVLGITALMKKHIEDADLGVMTMIAKQNRSQGRYELDHYRRANHLWRTNIHSVDDTVIPANVFDDDYDSDDGKDAWYNTQGESYAERYALDLLHHDVVRRVLEADRTRRGDLTPEASREVVGYIVRQLMIRRTKDSIETVQLRNGEYKQVTPGDDMQFCEVSTVDLAPGFIEHHFYQEQLAPLQTMRIVRRNTNDPHPQGHAAVSKDQQTQDSAIERLLVAGASHPYFAVDG